MVPLPPPLLVVLPPLAVTPLLLLRRRRRRVRYGICSPLPHTASSLTMRLTEKEESDEDMGFGLFD